jgi:hypothetical protein
LPVFIALGDRQQYSVELITITRPWIRMRTLMPALLVLSLLTTHGWAGDSMIDRRLRDAITAMSQNPVPGTPLPIDRGVRLLLNEGAMQEQADAMAKVFAETFDLVGVPQAVEEIAVRSYGTRSEVAYFVIPCQRGAAFIRIVSVKRGDNQRIVSNVIVSTRPEVVLPPGLLEPEPSARR